MASTYVIMLILASVCVTGYAPSAWGANTEAQDQRVAAPGPRHETAHFVGRQTCARCHQAQHALWRGSHHDLAMQEATEQTVLGNFDQASFSYFGVTSTFYKQGDQFMVRTDGADGDYHDYQISYTFGAYPLQQYLIAFPDGRLQALSIAWDSRPQKRGGQRWFHLYPTEHIAHDDPLHWTSLNQNWNTMCAECHSTHVKKHYDPQSARYDTTWAEIDVSCEACHGPGSRHVKWAQQTSEQREERKDIRKGLVVRLDERVAATWRIDPTSATPRRYPPKTTQVEIELCARCHSRRSVLSEDYVHGRPLLDTHLPSLLVDELYYPDGQIEGEVYVYGSFLQSKMYRAGVTCSDCHNPHSLQLRAPGNGVCTQCHLAAKFDTAAHHFHPPSSSGGQCVACHMPAKTYMVVDPRHDHSMRIPRPDLSVQLGVPNPCTQCHVPRTDAWAAAQLTKWYGHSPTGFQNFAAALHAGRSGAPSAERLLSQLADDVSAPPIARATALLNLRQYLSPASLPVLQRALQQDEPLLRVAAVQALEAVPPQQRKSLAWHLLTAPLRAVRVLAARWLAATPRRQLTADEHALLTQAIEAYIATQMVNAERPEAQLNLALIYADGGQFKAAEAAYRSALHRQPSFVPAYINLADLYRMQGKEVEGEHTLRQALIVAPRNAEVHYALGLSLIRQQRRTEAVDALAQAAALRPNNYRYSYVYAVALHAIGKPQQAIQTLEEAHQRHPAARDIIAALITYHREQGNMAAAHAYVAKLQALSR